MISVCQGDDIPRKGGPAISRSDLLVINKMDLAVAVGADLERMQTDATRARGERPFVLTNLKAAGGGNAVAQFVREAGGL